MKKLALFLSVLLLSSFQAATADWLIDNTQSQLNFISTKKTHVAEMHQFTIISGVFDDAGKLMVAIDLTSVDTSIDVRDERLKNFFFEVDQFSTARLTAQIEAGAVENLSIGDVSRVVAEAELSLHGEQQKLNVEAIITKLAANRISVVSSKPLLLNVSDFALVKGVEKLRELAGLPSISHAVPVSFYLTLVKK